MFWSFGSKLIGDFADKNGKLEILQKWKILIPKFLIYIFNPMSRERYVPVLVWSRSAKDQFSPVPASFNEWIPACMLRFSNKKPADSIF